jgi:predicted ribosome quality control (RQC) complex YloA/Tae2 family protein
VDGVFLTALLPLLQDLIKNRKCRKIGRPGIRDGFGFLFDNGILTLSARPDAPGLWWSSSVQMSELPSPAWSHHLEGALVLDLQQPGSDRILRINFKSGMIYGNSDITLVFEAAGRNANVILIRTDDGRILACHRKISSRKNRFRTIAPGQVYVPPPTSGLSPGSWSSSEELRKSVDTKSPSILYRMLEGVGPVTARAIVRHSERSGTTLISTVEMLEEALLKKEFHPWEGPDGPLPIRLGEGTPISDPLSMRTSGKSEAIRDDRLETWTGIVRKRLSVLRKRLSGVKKALDGLVSPEKYRLWGNLLLATQNNSEKGLDRIVLTDWNGQEHEIPLKPSRSLKSNAGRFFRKASNTSIEQRNLEDRERIAHSEIESLERSLELSHELTSNELDALLMACRKKEKESAEQKKQIRARLLSNGWRCFAGRNARENDEVTFRIGKRGDLWFHARGITGAHVILKLDGKGDNPPAEIVLEAAAIAAKASGVSRGVIPVDYTRVEYVNRIRKGKPGQVVYTREKTVFVDLDKLSRTRGSWQRTN